VPVALAVELGRVLLPKADPELHIYDLDKRTRKFRHMLTMLKRPQTSRPVVTPAPVVADG